MKKNSAKAEEQSQRETVPLDARNSGAPGRTRTLDPRLRRPLLYPAELLALVVGETGFEPATSSSQNWRATRLRHSPKGDFLACRRQESKSKLALYYLSTEENCRPRPGQNVFFPNCRPFSSLRGGNEQGCAPGLQSESRPVVQG
jgi:hypothetical protein